MAAPAATLREVVFKVDVERVGENAHARVFAGLATDPSLSNVGTLILPPDQAAALKVRLEATPR